MIEFRESHLVLTWGVTVILGWAATGIMAALQSSIQSVMLLWTILMIPPILMTFKLYLNEESNKVFNLWAILVIILMIENFLTPVQYEVYSYFLLWIIGGAAAFYYTSSKLPPPSSKTYKYAAFSSIAAIPIVYLNYQTGAVLGLLIQGIPLLYDYQKVHR